MILESIPEPPNDAQPRRLVCPHCHARLLYTAPGPETYQTLPDIRCGNSKCRVLLSDPTLPPPAKPAHPKGKARGSDERPCDRTYYDALGVAPDCSMKEIKAAYRVAALAHHPDKNRDDPLASERFRTIAVAYQVLSDPEKRKRYNAYGVLESSDDADVDPMQVFGTIFGGEAFKPLIGQISIFAEMSAAIAEQNEQVEPESDPAKMLQTENMPSQDEVERINAQKKAAKEIEDAKEREKAKKRDDARAERVAELKRHLLNKLSIFVEADPSPDLRASFVSKCKAEAEALSTESYGVDLLHKIGAVYKTQSEAWASTDSIPLGIGGWWTGAKSGYKMISSALSVAREAREVKALNDARDEAKLKGVTEEALGELDAKIAEKMMAFLVMGLKLELDTVLKQVCDEILFPAGKDVPRATLKRRAEALRIVADAYSAVKEDPSQPTAMPFKFN